MACSVQHIFILLLATWIFSLVKYPFKSCARFFCAVDLLFPDLLVGVREFFWIHILLGVCVFRL